MKQLNRQVSTDRNYTSSNRKYKSGDTKTVQTNLQVIGIYAGGHQIFVRISSRAHRPDDYRTSYTNRPLLELNLDFAKWLNNASQSSDTFKDVERKLARLFNTEACLNGSFLSLPDTHFRTSSSNPGIDLDQVIAVMEKLRSCDPKIQELLFEHIQSILLTLPETAPCFEALPPFAQAATRLKKTADGRVLDYWILNIGRKFVQRIIELYKPLVIKIIQINSTGSALAAEQYQTVLEAILELLKKVHNNEDNFKINVHRLLAQYSININSNYIDIHILKRAARKLLKQYNFELHDFPNLAMHEKITFLKTLFVRKYLDRKNNCDDEDDQSWNEQIKELIHDNHDLQIKLIDLFVDYTDLDSGVEWARFYNLEDFEIPEQIRTHRQNILKDDTTIIRSTSMKSSTCLIKQIKENIYKPTVLLSDIVYIELDTDVDPFLNRLECARCNVGSHLPFVGFDCETFMDPTQRTLNSQIISTIQLASLLLSRNQYLYGIFDMLALRLQFDIKSLAELAQRLFCSRDFILLTYNYACDTSSLIENYPSMNDALMQGTAVIDLFRVQQYNIQNLTTTTTISNSRYTVTTDLYDDHNDMTRILSYAVPLSCVVIIIVLLTAIGFNRRQHVLEKWTSLKRMKNTNPRCTESTGLRRDSEYDLCNDGLESVTIINEDNESDFRLATIA
ncbi:unnamed protein product [Rotaria sp. Silwood1]|nr:unnamed protein product [Rotaria sp. Silwood1]